MTRLTPGQQVTVSGRRMLVVRVETIDGITHVWVRRQADEIEGGGMRYRTIVADPPWPIAWKTGQTRRNGRGERHRIIKHDLGYETMSIDAIAAMAVADLAEDDAHLYLWVTPALNREGVGAQIARAWGFRVKSELIWRKRNFGLGDFPRPGHEPVLVCVRGKQPFALNNVHSVQEWDHRRSFGGSKIHSAKPDAFLDLVEQVSPGPYLELFARRQRLGWDTHGDEAFQHVEIPA